MSFLDNDGVKHLISKIKTYISTATVKKAATADKLTTARTITVSGNAIGSSVSFDGSSNISLPISEIYNTGLKWSGGGGDTAGMVTPLGAALIPDFNANRIAFAPNDCIVAEYSNDGGTTWIDCTNAGKSASLTVDYHANYTIGNKSQSAKSTTDDMVRITVTAKYNTIYCRLRKIFIAVSSGGAQDCKVQIEMSRIKDPDTFTLIKTSNIKGWSGWNEINMPGSSFGGAETQVNQYRKIRFTFSIGSLNSNTSYYNTLTINGLYFMGEDVFNAPSNLSRTGHMYKISYIDKSCEFPASVKISSTSGKYNGKFIGNLEGTASNATCDGSGNNIEKTYIKNTNSVIMEEDTLILSGGSAAGQTVVSGPAE